MNGTRRMLMNVAQPDLPAMIFKIDYTGVSNLNAFIVPVRGYSGTSVGAQTAPYDWKIDYSLDNVTYTPLGTFTGTGSASAGISLSSTSVPTAGQYYLRIRPNSTPTFGWGKAFGFGTNNTGAGVLSNKQLLREVVEMPMNACISTALYTGDFFNAYKYYGCTNLVIGEDTGSWWIIGPGNNFNAYKYYGCTSLLSGESVRMNTNPLNVYNFDLSKYAGCTSLVTPDETSNMTVSSITGTSVSTSFQQMKYFGCMSLVSPENCTSWSFMLNANTGMQYFHMAKYADCVNLQTAENTSAWGVNGGAGSDFCYQKYYGCALITQPEDTTEWRITSATGQNFCYDKYHGCTSLLYPEHTAFWLFSSTTTAPESFGYSKYYGCTSLTAPEAVEGWTIAGRIGTMGAMKYYGCVNLTMPEGTYSWQVHHDQGAGFCKQKYYGCTSLTEPEPFGNFYSVFALSVGTAADWLCYQMYYVDTVDTIMKGYAVQIVNTLNGGNIPYATRMFANRTGLSDFASLPANVK